MKNKHEMELKRLGVRIQQYRKALGLTQEDIADRMGCSLTYISKLENGKASCNLERLFELSNLLECDAAELLLGINMGSSQYLDPELGQMVAQLTPNDKELLCAMMEVMIRRNQKDGVEYAVP
ncbi:helix-turn-helix domain-containing protein [uncultured Subdoligranulum sp.]|uniref:helix-turn-helix domain-containing protein n=1 Tax=uncultured Subdoligranulum sp. TaxID=512298 RepID=UPI0025E90995|nr:helix-turn-helix transcriptional regulator [uncultured Subdoligranulum sp.]